MTSPRNPEGESLDAGATLHTACFAMPEEERRNYADLIIGLWPHLSWRHAGFGALQAYIREGGERELRVHLWHPSLARLREMHLNAALVALYRSEHLRLGYLRDSYLSDAADHLEAAGLPDIADRVLDTAGFGGDLDAETRIIEAEMSAAEKREAA